MSLRTNYKTAYIVAFTGVGAALYFVLLFLPNIPVLGTPASMDIGASLSPLFGLLLGPVAGPLAVLIGNTAQTLLPTPSLYLIPFIPAAALSALTASLLVTRKWWITCVTLLVILIASMFTPPFYPLTEQWLVYTIAFYDKVVALIIIPLVINMIRSTSSKLRYIGLYGLFFVAREVDKAFGCFIFAVPIVYEGIYGLSDIEYIRSLYMISPLYYLVTYLLEALIVTIIAIPTIKVIKKVPGLSGLLYVDKVKIS